MLLVGACSFWYPAPDLDWDVALSLVGLMGLFTWLNFDLGMHIINVIVIRPSILIIIKSPHLILIDYNDYIDYTLIS